jgi:hypothetical protein
VLCTKKYAKCKKGKVISQKKDMHMGRKEKKAMAMGVQSGMGRRLA